MEHTDQRGLLDPRDWEEFRRLAYQAVDDVILEARSQRDRKTWRPLPESARDAIRHDLSQVGVGAEETLRLVREHILPYRLGNIHPRFWTRMAGTGTLLGAVADLLASAMNSNAAGQESSATETETAVLTWLKDLLGLPPEASGVLTSGCSAAHLIGLTVARNESADANVNGAGYSASDERLLLYCSEETHNSIDKAVAVLGIGIDNIRRVAIDPQFRISLASLAEMVKKDQSAGLRPFCVVGNAATLKTGAIDDLSALADFCEQHELWFHVDAAFGAMLALSPSLKPKLGGIERADSVAFDLHKWMHMPYDIGCILVRDAAAHKAAFTNEASYLKKTARGPAASEARFYELGIDLSRSFRALKVWMGLTAYGTERYAAAIEQDLEHARHLACMIEGQDDLELLAPVPLNVVCFRHRFPGGPAEEDRLNEELVLRIQESGFALVGTVKLRGRTAIRLGIVNHRSRREDFDCFVDEVLRVGAELSAEGAATS